VVFENFEKTIRWSLLLPV